MGRKVAALLLIFGFTSAAVSAQPMPAQLRASDPLSEPPPATVFRGFSPSLAKPESKLNVSESP